MHKGFSMSTKHLTYRRPDGVLGVGFFIPWAGKFTHSVSWPDLPAERYTEDRLERMGVKVVKMWIDESFSGSESDETQQEAEGETSSEASEQTVTPDADVVAPDVTDPGSESQSEATGNSSEGDQAGLANPSPGTDESEATSDESQDGSEQPEADEVSEEAQVSEAQAIRDYLASNPDASNKEVVAALKGQGIEITSSQVTRQRKSTPKGEA